MCDCYDITMVESLTITAKAEGSVNSINILQNEGFILCFDFRKFVLKIIFHRLKNNTAE